jgi:cytochrome c oxidase subunit IV
MSDHEQHESHGGVYLVVFGLLCCFTVISWVADIIHMKSHAMLVAIVLTVATAKALCVMMYFMHLKFERAWKYMLLAPTFVLAAGMMIALLPDIGMHYYTVDVPQVHEHEADEIRDKQSAESHH